MSHLANRIDGIEDRTDHIESQLKTVIEAHDEMVDAHKEKADVICQLQLKVADLEYRSRRNNIKIRGVPEAVKPQELITYLQQLFLKIIHDLSPRNLLMDRVHRFHKPVHLPDTVPRDVLTRVHFYHSKEHLLRVARTSHSLPPPYAAVALYQDLSTSKLRK